MVRREDQTFQWWICRGIISTCKMGVENAICQAMFVFPAQENCSARVKETQKRATFWALAPTLNFWQILIADFNFLWEFINTFHTITNGEYSELLYKLFSKERVEAELEKFLEFDFFPRVGGGIGMTRMISAMETLWVNKN